MWGAIRRWLWSSSVECESWLAVQEESRDCWSPHELCSSRPSPSPEGAGSPAGAASLPRAGGHLTVDPFPSPWSARFHDLNVVRLKPGPTDDDVRFISDLIYCHELLDWIVESASNGQRNPQPFPQLMSRQLAKASAEIADIRRSYHWQ